MQFTIELQWTRMTVSAGSQCYSSNESRTASRWSSCSPEFSGDCPPQPEPVFAFLSHFYDDNRATDLSVESLTTLMLSTTDYWLCQIVDCQSNLLDSWSVIQHPRQDSEVHWWMRQLPTRAVLCFPVSRSLAVWFCDCSSLHRIAALLHGSSALLQWKPSLKRDTVEWAQAQDIINEVQACSLQHRILVWTLCHTVQSDGTAADHSLKHRMELDNWSILWRICDLKRGRTQADGGSRQAWVWTYAWKDTF